VEQEPTQGDLAVERQVAACVEEEQERFARFAGRKAIHKEEEVV